MAKQVPKQRYARLPDETWDEIRRRWETGASDSMLANAFETSRASIYNRRIAEAWSRDLKAAVNQRVADKVAMDVAGNVAAPLMVTAVPTDPDKMDADSLAVEAAAEAIVRVVREHRVDIQRGRALVQTLYEQLHDAIGNRAAIEAAIFEDIAEADDPESRGRGAATQRRAAMLKAVALPAHIGCLKDLSIALRNFVPLERQALGLDDARDKKPPPPSVTLNLNMRGRGREPRTIDG